MDNLDFENMMSKSQNFPEFTEEDMRKERLMMLDCCGTCKFYKHYFASGGICLKNAPESTKRVTLKDYMDDKCEKWDVIDSEKEFYEENKDNL